MEIITHKRCTKCGEIKMMTEFHNAKKCKDGKTFQCKTCMAEALKAWRRKYPEKLAVQAKRYAKKHHEGIIQRAYRWAKANPEKHNASIGRWHKANREKGLIATRKSSAKYPKKQRERTRKYRATNPDKVLVWTNNRRLRLTCGGEKVEVSEWIELKCFYRYTCLCCRRKEPEIKLTMDHVIPIFIGGRNVIGNIQPLCLSCNSKKHTQTADYRPK